MTDQQATGDKQEGGEVEREDSIIKTIGAELAAVVSVYGMSNEDWQSTIGSSTAVGEEEAPAPEIVAVYPDEERRIAAEAEIKAKHEKELAKETKKAKVRLIALPLIINIIIPCIVALMASIYMDISWSPFDRFSEKTKIGIINDDTTVAFHGTNISLGQQVVDAFTSTPYFAWVPMSSVEGDFNLSESELVEMTKQDTIWGALHIPKTFTATFLTNYYGLSASVNANSTYNNKISFIQDPTKQYTMATVVSTYITQIAEAINHGFLQKVHSGTFGPHSASAPYGVIFNPVALEEHDVHPLEHNGWYLCPYMVWVFFWLMTIMSVNIVGGRIGRNLFPEVRLHFAMAIASRYFSLFLMAIVLSGIEVGILHEFGVPAAHSYGQMYGVCLLSLVANIGLFYCFYAVLGQAAMFFSVTLLYIQLLTCGGMASARLLSDGWAVVGAILPMQHSLALMRYVAFDTLTADHGQHLGALFAWAIGGTILSIIPQYWGILDPKMKKNIKK